MKDFLIVWFNIDGEMICSSLTEADIKKGVKQVSYFLPHVYTAMAHDFGGFSKGIFSR